MVSIPSFYNLDIQVLRSYIYKMCLNNTEHKLFDWAKIQTHRRYPSLKHGKSLLLKDYSFLYNYFWLLITAEEVALQNFSKERYSSPAAIHLNKPILETFDNDLLICRLTKNDLRRVTMPVALTAWLTTDEFRWHKFMKFIPEDLNYGLVLQYPDFVIPYAAYVLNINREEQLNKLDQNVVEKCKKLAKNMAATKCK